MANACFELVIFIAIGLSLHTRIITSASGNETKQLTLLDNDDLSESDIADFKERYRRLIPYMTYYVVNNYVNQESVKGTLESSTTRRPQYFLVRVKQNNRYQDNLRKPGDGFIPSVQYDPKDEGPDSEHFTPIRYGTKINYKDYPLTHETYQKPYTGLSSVSNIQNAARYSTTSRPLKAYSPVADYLSSKPSIKPIANQAHSDYLLDYVPRPIEKVPAESYSADAFESLRYVMPEYSQLQKPVRISKPSIARPTSRIPPNHLSYIVKSLQLTNQLPEMLNKDNLDSSIKTLVEIFNILNGGQKSELPAPLVPKPSVPNYDHIQELKYERPRVITEVRYEATPNPIQRLKPVTSYTGKYKEKYLPYAHRTNNLKSEKVVQYYVPVIQDVDEDVTQRTTTASSIKEQDQYSYEIDHTNNDAVLQDDRFTLQAPPVATETPSREQPPRDGISAHTLTIPPLLKYGATRGKPHVDYPAYSTIPETNFNCKKQRYKGFFGDPATGCQVWHYCDLNGGKSSFLCPNGTIFSQVALTCDWWFNVKCESTTQLYVLNERLYKYILPIMPKFPEDFTGPEVDRYLELKFKEMEEKLKKEKLKKQKEEKDDAKDNLQTLKDKE